MHWYIYVYLLDSLHPVGFNSVQRACSNERMPWIIIILFIPRNYVALTGALTVNQPPVGLSVGAVGVLSRTLRLCARRAAVLALSRHQAALLIRSGAQGARCGAASPQRQRAFPSRRTGDRIDRSTHCLHHIHALTRAGD